MICVITRIREGVFKNLDEKHHIQVNIVIKNFYNGLYEKDLNKTIDTFWSEYTKLNNKNDSFDRNKFIWSSKYISDGNIHLWHQNYSLPSTKFLGVVAYRLTSNIIVI